MRRFLLVLAFLFVAPAAAAQGMRAYSYQYGVDAQHTGRSSYRGPHAEPRVLWRVRAQHRVFSSPALTSDALIVFAGVDGGVHALDRQGIERWAFLAPGGVFASPAVWEGRTIVGYDGGAYAALDARGHPSWTYRTPEDADASPALGPDGTLYVATRALVALGPDGALRWSTALGEHVFGAPALSRDGATVYVADLAGELLYVCASDGHVERRVRVGAPVYGAPLVLEDGAVVVGAGDGRVRAFGPDGTLRWTFATHDEVRATAALGRDGTVIVGSDDGGIYGLRANDGTQVFRVATSGRVRAAARVDVDGYVFVGSEDDVLYALDPQGAVAWRVTLGADIDSAVLITPWGALAVGCDDAALYYLQAR